MDVQTPDTGGTIDQNPDPTGKKKRVARGGPRNRRPIHFLLSVQDKTGEPVAATDLQVSVLLATRDSEAFFRLYTQKYGEPGIVQLDYTPNGDKPAAE